MMTTSVITIVLALLPPADQERKYAHPEFLVEPSALAKAIAAKKGPLVLDARPYKEYEAGRVPGAHWVDAAAWAKTFLKSQDPKVWGPLLANAGLLTPQGKPVSSVVIYDNVKSKDAARIWWILRYWNFGDVRLLNGGWTGWKAGDNPVAKGEVGGMLPLQIDISANPKVYAKMEDVLKDLKSKKTQIVDARSEGEYCGDVKFAKKGGSIPGAINLEWSDAIDPQSQRFKPAGELTKLLKDKGIDLDQPIITHCQSGGRAAVMSFTLELMGAKNVRNYYNGWSEWGNATTTPIATPKK